MVTVTIANIAPIKQGTRTKMYANRLEDGTYEALYIEDATSGVEYYSIKYMKLMEKAKLLRARARKICFEIEETSIYTDKTLFKAKEVECW